MKKLFHLVFLAALLAACGQGFGPVATETPSPSETPAPTATPSPEPTPLYPPEGYGPSGFPPDVSPLTGLHVADPALLERRPLLVKVTNLPRSARPQWGLSLADIVIEYYTEEGSTRFAALFYSNDAEIVGPIRSARFMDAHLVRGYKAVFAFGSAYSKVLERLYGSEFTDRLVIEGPNAPLTRYDPNGFNHLVVNTADLSAYMTQRGVANGRQSLDGMSFRLEAPEGGQPGEQFVVRYSGSIFNRWDYDPESGKYLRFHETDDDFSGGLNEKFTQAVDRLNDQPLAFENVVVLFATHEYYNTNPEVIDTQLLGTGTAYVFRDGQAYQVTWQRNASEIISLANPDGTPFLLKHGTTWFEIVGTRTTVEQNSPSWRFRHLMP